MDNEPTSAIKIFYCYAHQDKELRDELDKHLDRLKREGQIVTWHDREIQPGTEWACEIDKYLQTSDIILLLVSPDFMHSDYCYSIEMYQAIDMHRMGTARIIPVILRPTDWEKTALRSFQSLPKDKKAVTKWRNRDDAYLDIVNGIYKVSVELKDQKVRLRQEHDIAYRIVDSKAEFLEHIPQNMQSMIDRRSLYLETQRMISSDIELEREHRGWTQEYLADEVGVPVEAVRIWEHGAEPSHPYRQKLREVFDAYLSSDVQRALEDRSRTHSAMIESFKKELRDILKEYQEGDG